MESVGLALNHLIVRFAMELLPAHAYPALLILSSLAQTHAVSASSLALRALKLMLLRVFLAQEDSFLRIKLVSVRNAHYFVTAALIALFVPNVSMVSLL